MVWWLNQWIVEHSDHSVEAITETAEHTCNARVCDADCFECVLTGILKDLIANSVGISGTQPILENSDEGIGSAQDVRFTLAGCLLYRRDTE